MSKQILRFVCGHWRLKRRRNGALDRAGQAVVERTGRGRGRGSRGGRQAGRYDNVK